MPQKKYKESIENYKRQICSSCINKCNPSFKIENTKDVLGYDVTCVKCANYNSCIKKRNKPASIWQGW